MLLVDAVESQLCPVEIWPSSVLSIIFAFDPNMPFALTQLETVIVFFFGNGVPLPMACQFFAACSGHPFQLVKRNSVIYMKSGHNLRDPPWKILVITIYVREGTDTLTVPICLIRWDI